MQMIIKKWGNSLATRIPKAVANSIDLQLDQKVDIEAVKGQIVITPINDKREYSLSDLLCQCPAKSMKLSKEDYEWLNDKPVGREEW